ncbi:hypothetical protein BGZ65_005452, partial [Modicella reniformis]
MHPYLFFYLLGGVTFIPLSLLVTVAVLWIRLPKLDYSQPRPTDIPSSHLLLKESEKTTLGANDTTSTTSTTTSAGKSGSLRKKKKAATRVNTLPIKSDHKPAVSSSASITSVSSSSTVVSAPARLNVSKAVTTAEHKDRGYNDHATSDEEKEVEQEAKQGEDGEAGEEEEKRQQENDDDDDDDDDDDENLVDNDDDTKANNGDDDDNLDNVKDNETGGVTGPTTRPRQSDVPMQADPNLNREGYVRMTRVPRLNPATESISDYMTNMLFQPKNARPKDSYYAVLRYDILFL